MSSSFGVLQVISLAQSPLLFVASWYGNGNSSTGFRDDELVLLNPVYKRCFHFFTLYEMSIKGNVLR